MGEVSEEYTWSSFLSCVIPDTIVSDSIGASMPYFFMGISITYELADIFYHPSAIYEMHNGTIAFFETFSVVYFFCFWNDLMFSLERLKNFFQRKAFFGLCQKTFFELDRRRICTFSLEEFDTGCTHSIYQNPFSWTRRISTSYRYWSVLKCVCRVSYIIEIDVYLVSNLFVLFVLVWVFLERASFLNQFPLWESMT